MNRTSSAQRCDLCSLEAAPGKRLCPACRQMIRRLATIAGPTANRTLAGGVQPNPAAAVLPDPERARKLYERSLDLDLFSATAALPPKPRE